MGLEIESELIELVAPTLGVLVVGVTAVQFSQKKIKAPVAPAYHHLARIIMIIFAAVELLNAEEYYAGGAIIAAGLALE